MVTNFDYLKMNQNSLHLQMLPYLRRRSYWQIRMRVFLTAGGLWNLL